MRQRRHDRYWWMVDTAKDGKGQGRGRGEERRGGGRGCGGLGDRRRRIIVATPAIKRLKEDDKCLLFAHMRSLEPNIQDSRTL